MAETTYNGWKNYETWCINLWLNNDSYNQEIIGEMREESDDKFDLAEKIKDYVESETPEIGPSMYSDLIGHAICNADFIEIAEAFME